MKMHCPNQISQKKKMNHPTMAMDGVQILILQHLSLFENKNHDILKIFSRTDQIRIVFRPWYSRFIVHQKLETHMRLKIIKRSF